MPFGGLEVGEALGVMSLVFLTIAMFFFAETRNGSGVARIVVFGLCMYFVTLADSGLLIVCFVGFALYNLFRVVRP